MKNNVKKFVLEYDIKIVWESILNFVIRITNVYKTFM